MSTALNTRAPAATVPRATAWQRAAAFVLAFYCFWRQIALVAWESAVVVFYMKVLGPGLLDAQHPWVTGRPSPDQGPVWPQNIIYRSKGHRGATLESDTEIVTKVCRFLTKMVARSVPHAPEIPHGKRRRMPHAVNYLHGAVHYNGAFMIFDDIPDLMAHVTDPAFRRALLRFGRQERREVTLVLRQRRVDPELYAYCVGCVRGVLPWFANGNGPTGKPVLWGNVAPYPAINLINGAWMSDLFALWTRGADAAPRQPVAPHQHFDRQYGAGRRHVTFGDRLLAWMMFADVRARGFKGQLVFTHRKVIEPQRIEEYRQAGGYGRWAACHEVPNPLRRRNRRPESGPPTAPNP